MSDGMRSVGGVEDEHLSHSCPLAEWIVDRIRVVLVEQRRTGLVAGRLRRIERQIGEEALARRVVRSDLLELLEILRARLARRS